MVLVMLVLLAVDFARNSFGPVVESARIIPIAIAAAYFIGVQFFGMHPFWGVLGAMLVGAALLR